LCFAQRVVPGGWLAAIGLRGRGADIEAAWREVGAAGFDPPPGWRGEGSERFRVARE